jgi:hypothetical protein
LAGWSLLSGTRKYGSAFITLNREMRERLWKRVQEHAAPAPKGMKRSATQWVKPGLIAPQTGIWPSCWTTTKRLMAKGWTFQSLIDARMAGAGCLIAGYQSGFSSSSQYARKHPNERGIPSRLLISNAISERAHSELFSVTLGIIEYPSSTSLSLISPKCLAKPFSIWLIRYRRPRMHSWLRMSEYSRALAVLKASSAIGM